MSGRRGGYHTQRVQRHGHAHEKLAIASKGTPIAVARLPMS